MNWVLIVVLLILILSLIRGYHRGFLRIVYSMVSWIIILVFVAWATPYINGFLLQNTGIYEEIQTRCEEKIKESAQGQAENELNQDSGGLAELGINLPDSVANKILKKTADSAGEFMEKTGVYAEIARGIASFVVEGIAFFIALVTASILTSILSQILGIVSRIPVLKGVNRILGVFAGGVYGLVLIWIAFYIIAVCSTSDWGRVLVSFIYENHFLTFLYKNNIVLTIVLCFL